MALTKEEFDNLDETAQVRVTYTSSRITNFDQTFSRTAAEGVEKISDREWQTMWSNYHDWEAEDVEFTLVKG